MRHALLLSAILGFTTVLLSAQQPPGQSAGMSLPALENMHPSNRLLYFVMRRGGDWLTQSQQTSGLFHPGLNVSINQPLETAHFYHQAVAAVALARLSRLTNHPRYHVAAQQALLTLMSSTRTDAQDPMQRYTYLPDATVNRLVSAGLLLRVVHELPVPVEVRVKEAEGLAQFIKVQQQATGVLQSGTALQQVAHDAQHDLLRYQVDGAALEGLACSLNYSNASWKLELLQKAVQAWNPGSIPLAATPAYISAFAETFLRNKQQNAAVAVFNMADALCNAQQPVEAGRVAWAGGFVLGVEKKKGTCPTASDSARSVSALCDAYRVARQAGDARRASSYQAAVTQGVQYLASLQYTGAGVEHFAENYQSRVLGGFRVTPQEGILRLQDTAECVLAISAYLSDVCGVSLAGGSNK